MEYNFFDYLINGKLFGTRFNYDNKLSNKKITDSIYDEILNKFDIIYYLKSLNRLKMIENIFFDDNQRNLYRYLSEKEYYYKYIKKDFKLDFIELINKNIDNKSTKEYYINLFENNNHSLIDEKIFDMINKCIK